MLKLMGLIPMDSTNRTQEITRENPKGAQKDVLKVVPKGARKGTILDIPVGIQ
jgi:hypothetical protein